MSITLPREAAIAQLVSVLVRKAALLAKPQYQAALQSIKRP